MPGNQPRFQFAIDLEIQSRRHLLARTRRVKLPLGQNKRGINVFPAKLPESRTAGRGWESAGQRLTTASDGIIDARSAYFRA
jgi:hypothetical protein